VAHKNLAQIHVVKSDLIPSYPASPWLVAPITSGFSQSIRIFFKWPKWNSYCKTTQRGNVLYACNRSDVPVECNRGVQIPTRSGKFWGESGGPL